MNADILWHNMGNLNLYITATIIFVNSIIHLWQEGEDKMNSNKKFKEIYDKFSGRYGDLIIEHLRVLKELEKYRKMFRQQTSKIKKR